MPSTSTRRRLEVPFDVYAALTQVAATKNMPTAALATVWLQERLQQEHRDLYLDPNTYRYRVMHDRRSDARVYQCGPAPQTTDITADWLATLGREPDCRAGDCGGERPTEKGG